MPDVPAVLAALIWTVEVSALAYMAYRAFLGFLSLRPLERLPRGNGETRFLIIVPAHNEEQVIAETVESILALDYPKDMVSLYVVADRCEDATDEKAKVAGARVLVKQDATSGKGN